MFEKFLIRREQRKMRQLGIPMLIVSKAMEEIYEVELELRKFKTVHGWHNHNNDNFKTPVGNIQKEIEDAINTLEQVRVLFNQTRTKKSWTKTCRKKIIKQMRAYRNDKKN